MWLSVTPITQRTTSSKRNERVKSQINVAESEECARCTARADGNLGLIVLVPSLQKQMKIPVVVLAQCADAIMEASVRIVKCELLIVRVSE